MMLDLQCVVHKARGFNSGNFRVRHDRPQLIVDFRPSLAIGQWAPPLIFLSQKAGGLLRRAKPPVEYLICVAVGRGTTQYYILASVLLQFALSCIGLHLFAKARKPAKMRSVNDLQVGMVGGFG